MTEATARRAGEAPRANRLWGTRARTPAGHYSARALLVALAALSWLAAPAAEARSHRSEESDSTRATLEPGVSLAFPQDWFSCDNAVNEQLHGRVLPQETAARACTLVQGGNAPVHLLGLSPRSPTNLLVDRVPLPTLSGDALAQATPEMLNRLTQFTCSHIGELLGVAPQSASECTGTTALVAGHTAFVVRVSVSHSNGQIHKVRIYRIPYDQGELTLQFEYLAASSAAAETRIESIVASAQVEAGSYVAQPVTLSPAPGISLSIPAGWMACDDATNSLLGGAPDPLGIRRRSCSDVSAEERLAAFNPQLLQNVSVGVEYQTEKTLTEAQIADLSADRLTELTPNICDGLTKQLKDQNKSVDSCVLSLDQIAGHQALLVTVVGAFSPDDETERDRNRIYYVPYSQGFATLQFVVPITSEAVAEPLVDAVMKSLVVQ